MVKTLAKQIWTFVKYHQIHTSNKRVARANYLRVFDQLDKKYTVKCGSYYIWLAKLSGLII